MHIWIGAYPELFRILEQALELKNNNATLLQEDLMPPIGIIPHLSTKPSNNEVEYYHLYQLCSHQPLSEVTNEPN
jgi:hypothetical protein